MEGIKEIHVGEDNVKRILLTMLKPFIGDPTRTEINILAVMLEQKLYILNRDNRVTIRTKLNIEKLTFNNHLQKLKNKKLIYLDTKDGLIKINPTLINMTYNNTINVRINE